MKKMYQKPTLIVVRIETTIIVAASRIGIGDDVDNAFGAEGRRSDYDWEDDEY